MFGRSHSLAGYWSAETSKPSRQADVNCRLTSISQILHMQNQLKSLNGLRRTVPCARSDVRYGEIFVVFDGNIWVDVVAQDVLPKIMLEVESFKLSA